MKKIKYLLFTVLVFSLIALASCGGDKDIENIESLVSSIKASISEPYQVVTTTSIKDGQTEVYKRVITISLEKADKLSGTITTETYMLNSSFTLEKSTSVETIEDIKTDTLFMYNLNESYFTSYTVNNDGLISTVKASAAKDLLNSPTVEVVSDFPFNITLNNKRISTLSTSYKMNSKDVAISTIYSYID